MCLGPLLVTLLVNDLEFTLNQHGQGEQRINTKTSTKEQVKTQSKTSKEKPTYNSHQNEHEQETWHGEAVAQETRYLGRLDRGPKAFEAVTLRPTASRDSGLWDSRGSISSLDGQGSRSLDC